MSHGREIEIKLRAPEPARALEMVSAHGFTVLRERIFERNEVLDTKGFELRSAGKLLRLRTAGPLQTLTFKGLADTGPHKSREELEARLGPAENIRLIFDRLGYARTFAYEKYRTEFERSGEEGVVTIDETPIGNFFEIEGEPHWIDRVAQELGFQAADYITDSYGSLYRSWCRDRGTEPREMLFS